MTAFSWLKGWARPLYYCSTVRQGIIWEVKNEKSKVKDMCGPLESFQNRVIYYPRKAVYKDRLATFVTRLLKRWQKLTTMIMSEVFHGGRSYHVQCFYCSLQIKSWQKKPLVDDLRLYSDLSVHVLSEFEKWENFGREQKKRAYLVH